MNRRTILAATVSTAAVTVPGCSGTLRDDSYYSNGPSEIVSVTGSVCDTEAFEFGGEPLEAFTEESPATVALTLTNTSTSTYLLGFHPPPPFPPTLGEHDGGDDRIALLPPEGAGYEGRSEELDPEDRLIPPEPIDGCWRTRSQRWGVHLQYIGRTIKPGDSIVQNYDVLADHENESCLSSGTYEFEYTFQVEDTDDEATVELEIELE